MLFGAAGLRRFLVGRMSDVTVVLDRLRSMARPDQLEGMARFGMTIHNRLGVRIPDVRALARETGRDHTLALRLWDTGVAEARILAALVADPKRVDEELMERWVADFDSWDVCDQVCLNLFDRAAPAWVMVRLWADRDEEFVRRAAFALLACIAWHDRRAPDSVFVEALPLIERAASDPRNYVKKAVSWALRHIGKRNAGLHPVALAFARGLKSSEDKTARWIGADAEKDLLSASTMRRMGGTERVR